MSMSTCRQLWELQLFLSLSLSLSLSLCFTLLSARLRVALLRQSTRSLLRWWSVLYTVYTLRLPTPLHTPYSAPPRPKLKKVRRTV